MAETTVEKPAARSAIGIVAIAWLLPGAGHFIQKRMTRGALLSGSVLVMFVLGLLMRGAFFERQTGDLLTTVIYYGGFIADLGSGILYILAVALGYDQVDVAGHVNDYGTKFLVAAGLMNVLAIVDAYEIAVGKKS